MSKKFPANAAHADGNALKGAAMNPPGKYFFEPGAKFNLLTVVGPVKHLNRTGWSCVCDCGGTTIQSAHNLVNGRVKSCGCLFTKMMMERNFKHGCCQSGKTLEYRSWQSMKSRCYTKTRGNYKWYGAKGVTVCESWLNSFPQFLADMGKKPSPKHSIERIDNIGNYDPSNCRWATRSEQVSNMRSNHVIAMNGKQNTASNWCREFGLSPGSFFSRIRLGWDEQDALTKPVDPQGGQFGRHIPPRLKRATKSKTNK